MGKEITKKNVGQLAYSKEYLCFGVVKEVNNYKVVLYTPGGVIEVLRYAIVLIPSLIELIKLIWTIWKDLRSKKDRLSKKMQRNG